MHRIRIFQGFTQHPWPLDLKLHPVACHALLNLLAAEMKHRSPLQRKVNKNLAKYLH